MANKKPSEAAVQRALETIANIDKSQIARVFSKMKFQRMSPGEATTLRGKAGSRYRAIEEASKG